MAVTKVAVAAALVALASCATPENVAAPTQPTPPPTTQVPPTSTVPATTSTTTTTTTTVPLVEGIPPEALALIGAPMPEVDLSFADGFDGEVWFEAYVEWNRWAFANPEGGLETLAEWVVPESEQYESMREQLEESARRSWVLVGTDSLEPVTLEVATEAEQFGVVQLNLVSRASGLAWILDASGAVVTEDDFSGSSTRRSVVTVARDGGRWKLRSWG